MAPYRGWDGALGKLRRSSSSSSWCSYYRYLWKCPIDASPGRAEQTPKSTCRALPLCPHAQGRLLPDLEASPWGARGGLVGQAPKTPASPTRKPRFGRPTRNPARPAPGCQAAGEGRAAAGPRRSHPRFSAQVPSSLLRDWRSGANERAGRGRKAEEARGTLRQRPRAPAPAGAHKPCGEQELPAASERARHLQEAAPVPEEPEAATSTWHCPTDRLPPHGGLKQLLIMRSRVAVWRRGLDRWP